MNTQELALWQHDEIVIGVPPPSGHRERPVKQHVLEPHSRDLTLCGSVLRGWSRVILEALGFDIGTLDERYCKRCMSKLRRRCAY